MTFFLRGPGLALAGALILTPDALFMRWSGMDGLQMLGWRGLSMGAVFLGIWLLTARQPRRDLARLAAPVAWLVILVHAMNALLFPLGIANAPVAPVLLGVATVPVWAALLAHVLHGERAGRATWIATALTLAGIAIAVGDPAPSGTEARAALIGAGCGLGVALMLALNFVTLRHHPDLPILPAIGTGALLAGLLGWTVTGPGQMGDGGVAAILVTGLVILPLSFFALSQGSRHTSAANVSLLMLLETVLAPLWVWLGIGEAPHERELIGGAVVIVTLAAYLLHGRPRRRAPALASEPALPKTARNE
nr:DMT family transporter [Pseudoponticoccus marisrubri]